MASLIGCGNFCTVWHKMKQNRAVFGVLRYINFVYQAVSTTRGHLHCKFLLKGRKILLGAVFRFGVVKAVQNVKFSALSKCPFTTLLTCGTMFVQV